MCVGVCGCVCVTLCDSIGVYVYLCVCVDTSPARWCMLCLRICECVVCGASTYLKYQFSKEHKVYFTPKFY